MDSKKQGVSRREFLKTTGIATGTLIGGGIIGGLVGYNVNKSPGKENKTGNNHQGQNHELNVGLKFFKTMASFNILAQATERILPEDELGPGAIGLGVPYFIDNQLAGAYGMNAKEYMQGPFEDGAVTQGYQSRLTRAEIFDQGIAKLEEEAQSRYQKGFVELEPEQMDEILTAFQKGEVAMMAVTSNFFFTLLRQATLEGAYCDPIYNGNKNMEGWKMKGFPGHQFSYAKEIESKEFVKYEPQSISSMSHS
ncbi:gluconate 2-dehydrogenase subunit 3 family protein [Lysinibacillus endophyticus]|uniref:gluconate 2-dehydrogenase subunit 3 family protein n=1 Tax=Ureibacillus endophyticus TaxID=1978490 RepID=UPI003136AA8A